MAACLAAFFAFGKTLLQALQTLCHVPNTTLAPVLVGFTLAVHVIPWLLIFTFATFFARKRIAQATALGLVSAEQRAPVLAPPVPSSTYRWLRASDIVWWVAIILQISFLSSTPTQPHGPAPASLSSMIWLDTTTPDGEALFLSTRYPERPTLFQEAPHTSPLPAGVLPLRLAGPPSASWHDNTLYLTGQFDSHGTSSLRMFAVKAQKIVPVQAQDGVILLRQGPGTEPALSHDGGQTWQPIPLPAALQDAQLCTDNTTLWAFGRAGLYSLPVPAAPQP